MTTTTHRRDIIAAIGNTRDVLAQADAEGRVARNEINGWRADALERAADLAEAGYYRASAAMAKLARGEEK